MLDWLTLNKTCAEALKKCPFGHNTQFQTSFHILKTLIYNVILIIHSNVKTVSRPSDVQQWALALN
jgi:hypothetical protein